ncbi:hypothetical protein VTO42DRAFT_3087 [Malbranchea cinnamomea]
MILDSFRNLFKFSKMRVKPPLLMRILSHNIRYATSSPFRGERPWRERKQLVLNQHRFASRLNPETFLCLQEVLHGQLEDLVAGLNQDGDRWDYIGVGRNDGKTAGEYSLIFYRPDVWDLKHFKPFWLSETPDIPSKGWDAASIRIVTVGIFKHRASHQIVMGMSTHLDDQGSKSREEAAKLIIRVISYYLTESEYANKISGVFLAGDFNSEEHQEAYTVLTGDDSPLVDAAKQIDSSLHYGNYNTYTGFGYEGYPATRIDHILVGPRNARNVPWCVRGYGVLPNKFDDGVFNSDHRAVVVDAHLC